MVFSIKDVTSQMLPTSTELVPHEPDKRYVFFLQESEFRNDLVEHLYGPFKHSRHFPQRSFGFTFPHISANSTMTEHQLLRNEAEVSQVKQDQYAEYKRHMSVKDERELKAKKVLNELIQSNSGPPKRALLRSTLRYNIDSITIHKYKHSTGIYDAKKSTTLSSIMPTRHTPIIPISNSPSSSRVLLSDILPAVPQTKPASPPIIIIDDSDDDMEPSNDDMEPSNSRQLSRPTTPGTAMEDSDNEKEISDDDDNLLETYTDEEIEVDSVEDMEDYSMENADIDNESIMNDLEGLSYISLDNEGLWETDGEEELLEKELTERDKELIELQTVLRQIEENNTTQRNDLAALTNYYRKTKTKRKGGNKYTFTENHLKSYLNSINQPSSSKPHKVVKKVNQNKVNVKKS